MASFSRNIGAQACRQARGKGTWRQVRVARAVASGRCDGDHRIERWAGSLRRDLILHFVCQIALASVNADAASGTEKVYVHAGARTGS